MKLHTLRERFIAFLDYALDDGGFTDRVSIELTFHEVFAGGVMFVADVERKFDATWLPGKFPSVYEVLERFQTDPKPDDTDHSFSHEGVVFLVGDGDDSLSVQRIAPDGAQVWVRAFFDFQPED